MSVESVDTMWAALGEADAKERAQLVELEFAVPVSSIPEPIRTEALAHARESRGYERGRTFVYFIQDCDSKKIKIGYSRDPAKRMASIRRAMAPRRPRLKLLATFEGGRDEERELHSDLAAVRATGEWFAPTPEILEAVDEALSGNLDRVSWFDTFRLRWAIAQITAAVEQGWGGGGLDVVVCGPAIASPFAAELDRARFQAAVDDARARGLIRAEHAPLPRRPCGLAIGWGAAIVIPRPWPDGT